MFLPDLYTGDFNLTVQNASNPILGQNGQGVCGVVIHFDHTAICDISMVLTSPSGQSVTLIGPIGQFCTTNGNAGTDWNVTFLPCGDPNVAPDPGFSATWNNNQPWGANNSYTGSYYPLSGCLQNLTGPVNGNWTLTFTDGQANDVGNLYDYDIIFCDPSGINCFTCAAEAGELPQNDVVACQGDPILNLDLPPTYAPNAPAPPATEYSYTYVVSGPGGIIQAYEPGPDLSGYAAGTYTVCGLSYLTANASLIPAPNGSLTITQLRNQLNSNQPPFCGDLTTNCVGVIIKPLPPDVEETAEICAPSCFTFFGLDYCQTGTYTSTHQQNGCPYTATLYLTVHQPVFKQVFEVICPGTCSKNPSFPNACATGNYQATLTGANGCDSTVFLNLTVMNIKASIQKPVPQLDCSQDSVVLKGTGSTTGTGTTYLWTASNGGHIVGPTNGINATADAPGKYLLRVCRTQGGASCCDTASVTVTGSQTLPGIPALSGHDTLCLAQTDSFWVAPVFGAASYSWTVPLGVTINAGQGTTSVQTSWNDPGGGNICVTANNACGSGAPACINVHIETVPATPAIIGDSTRCVNTPGDYAILPVPGATDYTWTVPAGDSIVSGQDSTVLGVHWAAAPGGNVCVTASNGCGVSPADCLPVIVYAQPVANAGVDSARCGTSLDLSATTSVNGSSGLWSVLAGAPGTAAFSHPDSVHTNASVTQNGVYAFLWTESNGLCLDADTVQIYFNASPLIGQIQSVCDSANENYTITFPVSGGTVPYTVSGGVLNNGIFTSSPIVSGQNYAFMAADSNGCVSPTVSGSVNCNCSSDAGQMSLLALSACPGVSVTAQHQGGVLDGNDIGTYILHTNPGTALGSILAQDPGGIFSFGPGMVYGVTYYISYVVGNNANGQPDLADPCLSVAQGQPVTFYDNPVADAGPDAAVCGLTLPLNGNAGLWTSLWSLLTAPAGGTAAIANAQNAATSATADVYGTYAFRYTINANGCTGSDTVALAFHPSPATGTASTQCDATNQNFTVSFPINGGTAPYTVNGSAVTGTVFQSPLLPNGSVYDFAVADANGCTAPPLAGTFSCSCATDAGQMGLQALSACPGASMSATHQGGALDANDIGVYMLHTGNGTALGAVLAQNNTGTFSFGAGMNYGTTYYISYVVGNNLNGQPDPNDPCLAVAPGQPVTFYDNPVADAGPDTAICSLTLPLNGNTGSGTVQWTLSAAPPGGTAAIANPQNTATSVTATQYGAYTFAYTWTTNGCSASDAVVLTFNESPAGGAVSTLCDATNQNYTASFPINGGTAPYTVNGTLVTGAGYQSALLPNGSAYSFTITDANGCVSPPLSGTYTCSCATDAGQMGLQALSACPGVSVTATHQGGALDANDIGVYMLHTGNGTALGTVLAQNSSGSFSFGAGMSYGTTYYISYVVGNNLNGQPDPNDPCLAIAPGQPVTFYDNPVADAGSDAAICGQTLPLNGNTGIGTAQWTLSTAPPGGTAAIANPQNAATSVTVTQYGAYTFTYTRNANGCSASDAVTLAFNASPAGGPVATQCDATNQNYTVSFPISGGTAPYSINGTLVTGAAYQSAWLPSGSVYSYTIADANGCMSPALSGTYSCACATNAGQMSSTPLSACAGDTIAVQFAGGQNLDANDTWAYVLHTGSGTTLGTVLAQNQTGLFSFGAGMSFDVPYYVSRVAGNNQNGIPSPSDPCFSVSKGQPVVFHSLPAVSGVTETCNGTNTAYTVQFTVAGGTAPYFVSGLNGGFAGNAFTSVLVPEGAAYTFTLTDVNGCSATTVSGMHACACATSAGTMGGVPAVFCAGQPATAVWNNNAALDADDIVRFYLHSQSGPALGTVYATNNQPVFNFSPPLQTGITYYISAVAGNGKAGIVDLNDPCLNIAPGAPVQWKTLPDAALAGDTTLCVGGSAALRFSGSGSYPLQVSYSTGTGNPQTILIPGPQTVLLPVSPQTTTTYTLVTVSDGTVPACSATANGAAKITVYPYPVADAGPDQTLVCAQTTATLGGPGTTSGTGISYAWTRQGAFVGNTPKLSISDAGTYKLLVTNAGACADSDTVLVTVDNTLPVAHAIHAIGITCFGDKDGRIVLDSVESAHPPVLFSLNGGPFGTLPQFAPLPAGNYVVTLQDAAGCEWSTDTIPLDQPAPVTVDLGPTLEIDLGELVTLNAAVLPPPGALQSVVWTPLLDTLHAGTLLQEFVPLASMIVRLSVTDSRGCAASDDVQVVVRRPKDVFIPNVIKPGAGLNERLVVFGGKSVAGIDYFRIFDRWGEPVYEDLDFQPNALTRGWDGRVKGKDAGPGVYAYYALVRYIDGRTELFRGDVTVVR